MLHAPPSKGSRAPLRNAAMCPFDMSPLCRPPRAFGVAHRAAMADHGPQVQMQMWAGVHPVPAHLNGHRIGAGRRRKSRRSSGSFSRVVLGMGACCHIRNRAGLWLGSPVSTSAPGLSESGAGCAAADASAASLQPLGSDAERVGKSGRGEPGGGYSEHSTWHTSRVVTSTSSTAA